MKEVSISNFKLSDQRVIAFELDSLSSLNEKLGFLPENFYGNLLTLSESDVKKYKISKISNFIAEELGV